jgi:hypothetical protein
MFCSRKASSSAYFGIVDQSFLVQKNFFEKIFQNTSVFVAVFLLFVKGVILFTLLMITKRRKWLWNTDKMKIRLQKTEEHYHYNCE